MCDSCREWGILQIPYLAYFSIRSVSTQKESCRHIRNTRKYIANRPRLENRHERNKKTPVSGERGRGGGRDSLPVWEAANAIAPQRAVSRERRTRVHPSQWVTHGKLERFHLQAEDSIFLHGRNYRFFFRSSVSRLQVNKSAPLAQRNGLPIFAPRHNFRRRGERRRESSRARFSHFPRV